MDHHLVGAHTWLTDSVAAFTDSVAVFITALHFEYLPVFMTFALCHVTIILGLTYASGVIMPPLLPECPVYTDDSPPL